MADPRVTQIKGDALAILSIRMGRGDRAAFDGIYATDVGAVDVTCTPPGEGTPATFVGQENSWADLISEITTRVHNKDGLLKLGPAPGMPFFVPKSECGDGKFFPALAVKDGEGEVTDLNQWADMTKEKFRSLPYTFIRKSLRIQDLEVAGWNKSQIPQGVINPQELVFPLDLQPSPFSPSKHPGYSAVVYDDNLAGGGFDRSAWLFIEDGIITTTWIEHRTLKVDGSEAAYLTKYWKPEDIYNNVILPRINRNMPIKKFGWNWAITAAGVLDVGLVHTGWLYRPMQISAAQCLVFIAPEWLNPLLWAGDVDTYPLTTWEAWANDDPTAFPVIGSNFNHYYSPAFVLPCFFGIFSDMISTEATSYALLDAAFALCVLGNGFRFDTKDPYGFLQLLSAFAVVMDVFFNPVS